MKKFLSFLIVTEILLISLEWLAVVGCIWSPTIAESVFLIKSMLSGWVLIVIIGILIGILLFIREEVDQKEKGFIN